MQDVEVKFEAKMCIQGLERNIGNMELKVQMCHSKENVGLNETSENPTPSIGTKSLVPLRIANENQYDHNQA